MGSADALWIWIANNRDGMGRGNFGWRVLDLSIVRSAVDLDKLGEVHSVTQGMNAGAIIDQGAPRKRRFLAVQN